MECDSTSDILQMQVPGSDGEDSSSESTDGVIVIVGAHRTRLTSDVVQTTSIDKRSIYVGNVDYSASAEDLKQVFESCGTINRVTIVCNDEGHPKGFGYVEFAVIESVDRALEMAYTSFRGHMLIVKPKRTNQPGITTTNRVPRYCRGRVPFRCSRQPYRRYRYGPY